MDHLLSACKLVSTHAFQSSQRQAAHDLAEGRFNTAVQALNRHGAVTWTVEAMCRRLMTVPGVGPLTASAFRAPSVQECPG